MTVSMPTPDRMYFLAKRNKDRAARIERETGDTTAAMHLNHVGNQYLIANEGREIK